MTLEEAKALLVTAQRDELQDHAFGDSEVYWLVDDKQIAYGGFGGDNDLVAVHLHESTEPTIFRGDEARALRGLGTRGTVERNDRTGPAAYVEGQTMPGLTREGVLTELTARACRACSECDGNHHFSESGLEIPGGGTAFFTCKHCPARAHVCEQCDGPIFPITGAAICRNCTADLGDFDEPGDGD